MDYTVVKGAPEDYEDIIDFANYVFEKFDYPSLLPKIYKGHRETAQYHHIVKEDHRIKAMVGSFPLGFQVCDNYLKMRSIGTVSVHRYSRGLGYMKLLMNNAIAEMKAEGCDLAILGGQRQRYEYWGFTPCGININMNFNSSNIKHAHIDVKDNFEFVEYDKYKAIDLEKAIKLHDSQIAHVIRKKDEFTDVCSTWNNRLIFTYNKAEFIGYICTSANREKIGEIVLADPGKIDMVTVAYMNYFSLKNMSVAMYSHRPEEFMKLSRLCEDFSINNCCNIYIINYINVIKSFMDLKKTFSPLCDGILVINVEGKDKYRIEVKGGAVTVEKTDMLHDVSLSHLDVSTLLFSHSSFINSTYCYNDPLVKEWFPLPLFYPGLDGV